LFSSTVTASIRNYNDCRCSFNNSQIGIEVQIKDDKDVEAHVTQWQELKEHDIVQQRQEQEFTEIIKKAYAKIMAEEDHNFRHGADGAREQQYTYHQHLGWQECDGGLKKMSRRYLFQVNSIQTDPSQSLR
jgi:hypothetical protein